MWIVTRESWSAIVSPGYCFGTVSARVHLTPTFSSLAALRSSPRFQKGRFSRHFIRATIIGNLPDCGSPACRRELHDDIRGRLLERRAGQEADEKLVAFDAPVRAADEHERVRVEDGGNAIRRGGERRQATAYTRSRPNLRSLPCQRRRGGQRSDRSDRSRCGDDVSAFEHLRNIPVHISPASACKSPR